MLGDQFPENRKRGLERVIEQEEAFLNRVKLCHGQPVGRLGKFSPLQAIGCQKRIVAWIGDWWNCTRIGSGITRYLFMFHPHFVRCLISFPKMPDGTHVISRETNYP